MSSIVDTEPLTLGQAPLKTSLGSDVTGNQNSKADGSFYGRLIKIFWGASSTSDIKISTPERFEKFMKQHLVTSFVKMRNGFITR